MLRFLAQVRPHRRFAIPSASATPLRTRSAAPTCAAPPLAALLVGAAALASGCREAAEPSGPAAAPAAAVTTTAGSAFIQASAGNYHTCGVSSQRYVYCWGMNSSGQLGDGTWVAKVIPVAVRHP
jgi:hypothetical protein